MYQFHVEDFFVPFGIECKGWIFILFLKKIISNCIFLYLKFHKKLFFPIKIIQSLLSYFFPTISNKPRMAPTTYSYMFNYCTCSICVCRQERKIQLNVCWIEMLYYLSTHRERERVQRVDPSYKIKKIKGGNIEVERDWNAMQGNKNMSIF